MDYQQFLDENPTWDDGSSTLWDLRMDKREITSTQFNIGMLLLSTRERSREEGRGELDVTPSLINSLVEGIVQVRLGNYTGSEYGDMIEAREGLPNREETIVSIIEALEELQ